MVASGKVRSNSGLPERAKKSIVRLWEERFDSQGAMKLGTGKSRSSLGPEEHRRFATNRLAGGSARNGNVFGGETAGRGSSPIGPSCLPKGAGRCAAGVTFEPASRAILRSCTRSFGRYSGTAVLLQIDSGYLGRKAPRRCPHRSGEKVLPSRLKDSVGWAFSFYRT